MATLEVQRAMAIPRGRQLLSRRLFLSGFACALAHVPPGRAGADTVRQLTLVRPATGESARKVPFWSAGAPYQQGLAELNWLLRDVQAEQVHAIDLRVYSLLAMLQAELGGQPIIVTSGYRTEATNERLRQQGIDAARNSFHLRGRAADVNIQGVSPARLAVLGSLFGLGGVGLYRDFVHLDTGPRRFWTG